MWFRILAIFPYIRTNELIQNMCAVPSPDAIFVKPGEYIYILLFHPSRFCGEHACASALPHIFPSLGSWLLTSVDLDGTKYPFLRLLFWRLSVLYFVGFWGYVPFARLTLALNPCRRAVSTRIDPGRFPPVPS